MEGAGIGAENIVSGIKIGMQGSRTSVPYEKPFGDFLNYVHALLW